MIADLDKIILKPYSPYSHNFKYNGDSRLKDGYFKVVTSAYEIESKVYFISKIRIDFSSMGKTDLTLNMMKELIANKDTDLLSVKNSYIMDLNAMIVYYPDSLEPSSNISLKNNTIASHFLGIGSKDGLKTPYFLDNEVVFY